jgi:2-amino-4-hydroxy-6-hydroxymethyldihydropteridine diphosphokinase
MRAVIALGSNLGNPKENLDLAVALLQEATNVEKVSSYYITKPVGYEDQADFVNAVCIIETELPAMELLNMLHGIEKAMGREMGPKNFRFRHNSIWIFAFKCRRVNASTPSCS